jgi:hypothetical protein
MKIEVGKTYFTKHSRFVKITLEPWKEVFNGEYEQDGRGNYDGDRWLEDGKCWNYIFPSTEFHIPEKDIIMEDCPEARQIAADMKLKRKQKAYDETN